MPFPHDVLCRLFCSPVPAQMMLASPAKMARSPKVFVDCPSKMGAQVTEFAFEHDGLTTWSLDDG